MIKNVKERIINIVGKWRIKVYLLKRFFFNLYIFKYILEYMNLSMNFDIFFNFDRF